MHINITPQQEQQILQSKEFADKFNELTTGWKPEGKLPYSAKEEKKLYVSRTPFAVLKMDIETYREFRTQDANEMEWGMIHKLCVYVLNRCEDDYTNVGDYTDYITPYVQVHDEIVTFTQSAKNKALQHAAGILSARSKISR